MTTLNMKHILTGKIKHLPIVLDRDELVDFADSLTVALAALRESEYPDMVEGCLTTKEWDAITDNWIRFFIDNDQFTPDIIIHSFIQALRIYEIPFGSETDTFGEFFDTFHKWIIQEDEPMKVYVGDGKYQDHDTWSKSKKSDDNYCGGHFSLREHHLKKNDDA